MRRIENTILNYNSETNHLLPNWEKLFSQLEKKYSLTNAQNLRSKAFFRTLVMLLLMVAGSTGVWAQDPTEITSLSSIGETGDYIIKQDINASGFTGIASFSGTLTAQAKDDGTFPVISNLSAPLFTTATDATISNIILDGVSISQDGCVGAIAGTADGATRIYNCGILSGEVGSTGSATDNPKSANACGGIVGLLDGTARVINCYSYATITGGNRVGGIVGYNDYASTASDIQTMVMNCMFYGDITGGNKVSPVYGGFNINNVHGGLNTYNYYAYDKLKTKEITDKNKSDFYNCALAVEEKFLTRFEIYRQLLNSNKKLAALYASTESTTVNPDDMAKWVLETADRSITNPKPYPVLKAQGKYPSIINYDVENAPDSATVGRNHGGKLGKTLTVHIGGVGDNAPSGASIIMRGAIMLPRTDKDFDHYNFNYDKVQLPYYNDYGTGNYTGNKVVTGWKITSISGGTAGTFNAADEWGGYNFADRNCTNKDLYSVSGRVFSQGAYFDVPYGVTAITIEPYWGEAAYVSDEYMDVVHNANYAALNVEKLGKPYGANGVEVSINRSTQKVYTTISNAVSKLSTGGTVYDHAVVLVGNVHLAADPPTDNKSFTIMSADLDFDNEPDCSFIFGHNNRKAISPVRFDFINMPGIAMVQKPNGAGTFRNVSIFKPKGWFEITNTSFVRLMQFEYDNGGKSLAPVILQGGYIDQIVSTQSSNPDHNTSYIHVGGNAWFSAFGNGTHSDGWQFTPHIPISVTGGDFDGFYLSGTYRPDAIVKADDAECYISGGRFGEAAGASQQQIDGNVHWQIYNADINEFYGGGVNSSKPVTGNISVDIYNSYVGIYCGGPKFGDMQKKGTITLTWATNKDGTSTSNRNKTIDSDRTVTTNARSCVFGTYYGAGYGGISYNRVRTRDDQNYNFSSWQSDYTGKKGMYLSANNGVATDFDFEFFVWSTGVTGGRFYVKYSSLSTAKTNNVSSTLRSCTINKNYYGGGNLGNVDGTSTSVLDGCTVEGNVYGGGYSASKPIVPLRTAGFTTVPKIDKNAGVFDMGEMSDTVHYTLVQGTLTNNTSAINTSEKTIVTDVDFSTLGQVTSTDLTISGNTIVKGQIFNADGTVKETTGGVFGGGDMSAVNENTLVKVQNTDGTEGVLNVFGGGNTADVEGNTEVTMTGGKVTHDVFGGGKGATTHVGATATVNFGKESAETPGTYEGTGVVNGNIYGGSALGTVNAAVVNLYKGTMTPTATDGTRGNVFGGGMGEYDSEHPTDNNAVVTTKATVNQYGIIVPYGIYGGCNTHGTVADTEVNLHAGTVGIAFDQAPTTLPDVVFGGGLGAQTSVTGTTKVELNATTDPAAMKVYGNVYGGSKNGGVAAVDVNLLGGTIWGNVYGGGYQTDAGKTAATRVNVTLDGTKFDRTYDGTAQIFGANNLQGTPTGHVKVHVKRTVGSDKTSEEALSKTRDQRTTYDVAAVYGGGNQADYVPTDATLTLDTNAEGYDAGNPAKVAAARTEVIIEGCEATSIQYVYGGGNAAAVPATDVTIKGSYIINTIYGGGNGSGTGNPGANVGIINPTAYAANHENGKYGTGKAVTRLLGGYINSVYGGSNTKGDIAGGTDVRTKERTDNFTGPEYCTDLNVGNVYGAGSKADMDGDVNIVLECMPEDYVAAVFGGAEQATVNGNVSLVVTSGKFGRVFGGNNAGGDIHGSITVNVSEDGCKPLMIGELYGGGNEAPYSIYGCTQSGDTWTANTEGTLYFNEATAERAAVEVYVYSCTSIGKIFGGGNQAEVIGNTRVWVNTWKGYIDGVKQDNIGKIGQVFGGGNAARVKGNTLVDIGTALANEGEDIGVNITNGNDYLSPESDTSTSITAGIYGGGYSADVEGDATLNIGTVNQNMGVNIGGDIFGGGFGETTHVTGDVTVNIGKRTGNETDGYAYVGYANITGDVYGGSAKGKVNSSLISNVETATEGKETQVNLYGGTISGNLYGGGLGEDDEGTDNDYAADVYGAVTVNVEGGKVTNVFGCNNVLGSPKSTATVNIHGMEAPVEPATYTITNVYGGGKDAAYTGTGGVSVAMTNGWVNDVFGGGLGTTAIVNGETNVTLSGGSVINDVYGGGSQGNVTGDVTMTLSGGTVGRDVYGGGALAQTNTAYTSGSSPATNVTLSGATITRNLYGGGLGDAETAANVNGPVTVAVTAGSATNVFGCNNINGAPQSTVDVEIGTKTGETTFTYGGTGTISESVYGGGNQAACTSSPAVKIYGGTINNNVYGGGLGATAVTGGTSVTMEGGLVKNDVYGGGSLADVTGSVSVSIAGGTVTHDVYGGGALANTNTANWNTSTNTWSDTSTAIYYAEVKHLTVGASVTGFYTRSGEGTELSPYEYEDATGTATKDTKYYKKLDGFLNVAANGTTYQTSVSLTGGTIGNAYGGGLGRFAVAGVGSPGDTEYVAPVSAVEAMVYGDVSVTVNGTKFTKETERVDGKAIPTTGRVFGCNNKNGTPKGSVLVWVKQTKRLDGAADHVKNQFEIQAVYGGGNMANYSPNSEDGSSTPYYDIQTEFGKKTQVLIQDCGTTSIERVYGGGNASNVPFTDVTIDGSFQIGYVFGGGNGGDKINKGIGAGWEENPGANVTNYTNVLLNGGTIGDAFGGSDSKGTVGGTNLVKSSGSCPLVINNVYGASKEADSDGDVILDLSGCGSGEVDKVFGGSYNANVRGNVTINITSGIYTSVYGGNDRKGSIGGNIIINIEEVDACNPIIIQNLFGGGSEADYPGAGAKYVTNEKDESGHYTGEGVTYNPSTGTYTGLSYADFTSGTITLNIKAATRIDKVFGGCDNAKVTGNTAVNINMVKGRQANNSFSLPASYTGETIPNIHEGVIDDAIGTIGNVYGGGNQGDVDGDATVNIGTLKDIAFVKTPTHLTANGSGKYDVLGANITGDVFGGGNEGNVTGNTTVNISTADYSTPPTGFVGVNIENGSVYGGGNSADVLGNTSVTMSGGYVFNGIFGGGYSGSVGTFTKSENGKPTACTTGTGKCTVVVNGNTQVGPVEVATEGMPNPHGWVWGGGFGIVEDPATHPDTHFKTYVGETDVTIGGTAFIMEGVIGGGEFGRVLGNTLVKIQGNCQIGVGEDKAADGKPVRYTDAEWTAAKNAVTSGNAEALATAAAAMPECSHSPYGRDTNSDGKPDEYLPYDPYYDKYYDKDTGKYKNNIPEDLSSASTAHPSDGKTRIGVVFGGGSGYMPYEKDDGTGYDWLSSAGLVEGSTRVEITGGHILTNVYGGNEYTDVTGDSCVVIMTGGTLGVPRTVESMKAHPVTCYLFGAGKGDERTHFNTMTNVKNTRVHVGGTAFIFGSVFGGGEDGHILENARVDIFGGNIGTTGTSYVDGNVFGGGRGFSGGTLGAGNVNGNVTVNIEGGTMLGSVYGGGRMASVGTNFSSAQDPNTGQFIEGDDHGHITINISGGTIGNDRENAIIAANGHTKGGNVFGGSMGRLTLLNENPNPLWTRLAQAKTSTINIKGGAIIKSNVYGGAEFGTTRDNVYITVGGTRAANGTITKDESTTAIIHGHVYGGGYGSTEDGTSYISNIDAGTTRYLFTPMQYAGIVGGETEVNIVGGQVKRNVYGGGEMASVGIIDYSVTEDESGTMMYDAKKYSYANAVKHADITGEGTTSEKVYGFGLSWPYKFNYLLGGKTTVNVTSGRIGTNWDDGTGYVFGGGKGKAFERYKEAHIANVRETEVNIRYTTTADPANVTTANCVAGAVYGGGEDGHVYENAVVDITGGLIGLSVYGGGKGEGTYKGKLRTRTGSYDWKATEDDIPSWTTGKVYGNSSVTMSGGHVLVNVYGGGNRASVGKGNYASGTDDYYPAGYGETLNNEGLWTASEGFNPNATITESNSPSTMADYFLCSGKSTVTITAGTVGTQNGMYGTVGGLTLGSPTGMVFGGSRGKAAEDVGALSPRYDFAPDFFLGYVNNTEVTIGDGSGGPTIYSQVFGGGRDGHVRGSTHVTINKGTIGQSYSTYESLSTEEEKEYQRRNRGNVYGSGTGMGTWDGTHHGQSSGSVTRNTIVDINGGTIYGNVYGGGAMACVGPPKIGTTEYAPKTWSLCQVNISGGTIGVAEDYEAHGYGGCVYGASRGGDIVGTESPDNYATTIWNEVNILPNATPANSPVIAGNVYGGGQAGRVKKDNVVNLTGGAIGHDAYGGGRGTETIAADVGGNTTVELNKGVANTAKGCSLERIFGCNDMNGTPKGHALVHVYATQNNSKNQINLKYNKRPAIGEGEYKDETIVQYLKRLLDAAGADGVSAKITTSVITDATTTWNNHKDTATLLPADSTAVNTAIDNVTEELCKLYDVKAVYGGGNLAKYDPTDAHSDNSTLVNAARTEVIIDGCDLTSIRQVYGGGNAAPVPGTSLTINAAYEIDKAFGGGNGKDDYQIGTTYYKNPGANVGYTNYTHYVKSDETGYSAGTHGSGTEEDPYKAIENSAADEPTYHDASSKEQRQAYYRYGVGEARTDVLGGRIHYVYGGSNEKGNISTLAMSVYDTSVDCPVVIDKSYGAGKHADIDGETTVSMNCMDYTAEFYGASEAADVNSDVILNISNGHFGKIFGGNDRSGHIRGSITINIQESSCKPIVIGELYGGGFEAGYSIYGYKSDGSTRTKAEFESAKTTALTGHESDTEEQKNAILIAQGLYGYPKNDPRINIISATKINTIYGGGYNALVVGSPYINVNMQKGIVPAKYADDTPANFSVGSHTISDTGGGYTYEVESYTTNNPAVLAIGTIGNIYGGGNLADVDGNTNVEIGTGRWISTWDVNGNPVWESEDASGNKFTYKETNTAVTYTQDECNTYNATLAGALPNNGTTALTAEQANAYNATLTGAIAAGTKLTGTTLTTVNGLTGVSKEYTDNEAITAADAALYNATLSGAVASGGTLSAENANTYNAALIGARNTNDIKTPAEWKWFDANQEETDAPTTTGRNAATITGNVFGGGKGETKESGDGAFKCESAMVGVDGDGLIDANGGTSVTIGNGSVGTIENGTLKAGTGNVYGGGEIGRVEKNTVVTIGLEGNTTNEVTIMGDVFGAGKGVATHGYSALVRGNSTVTIQGKSKVGGSVYGGGEIASVGRYNVNATTGLPESLANEKSGNCTVIVRDDAEIGPNDMVMTRTGGPDDKGHVFGAGKGVLAYDGVVDDPWRVKPDNSKDIFNTATYSTEATAETKYLGYLETLGLATQTNVTISGNAFVKGSVYGGSENGYVQHDTHVTIEGGQIGNGYVQMADDGTYLASPYSLNRRYTDPEWTAGHLIKDGESNYSSSLPECASWTYAAPYSPHDKFASTTGYDAKDGAVTALDGHTFYGNVFGGGSGYYPYKPGKWHFNAGAVGGNTVVDITGGHILTNVYGGNEMTNVGNGLGTGGKCTIKMTGGTLGVPRTLGQIAKHPVTCYLFGGGKGDQRIFFNKQTNVKEAEVEITGGWIYGSVFGGGEDGHVLGDVKMTIGKDDGTGPTIGTWGTSYVDGNVFGGGRGYSGEALTAGNVGGSIDLEIKGGAMLGSIYGGGRLGSVGYGLYDDDDDNYGVMRDDDEDDDGTATTYYKTTGMNKKGRGYIDINISGGTIGNDHEYKYYAFDVDIAGKTAKQIDDARTAALNAQKATDHIPNTEFLLHDSVLVNENTKKYIYRQFHTKGGNVHGGGMGRLYGMDGETALVRWFNLGAVKSTKITISGGTIKSSVYGGCELGQVAGNYRNASLFEKKITNNVAEDEKPIPTKTSETLTDILITGGSIGSEIKDDNNVTRLAFGAVYGGGYGNTKEKLNYTVNNQEYESNPKFSAGIIEGNTQVVIQGGKVLASVYGGGKAGNVHGNASVSISGATEIGKDKDATNNIYFGGALMGNVYGGGAGDHTIVRCGQIFGNTSVSISNSEADAAYAAAHEGVSEGDILSPHIYHNVYGGGSFGTVGRFKYKTDYDEVHHTIKVFGVESLDPDYGTGTGKATINITGGTIGIDGKENGMVFGSSRGEVEENYPRDDYMAWVYDTEVTIGDENKGTTKEGNGMDFTWPQIKGSVYGGGENGHNLHNAVLNIHSGTIGIPEGVPLTATNPDDKTKTETYSGAEYPYRGNVYGAGCGTDTYRHDGVDKWKELSGIVKGNTTINIDGGHIVHNVYGGGAMASVGDYTFGTKHESIGKDKDGKDVILGFGLSWPQEVTCAANTGKATINISGGRIGVDGSDNGDVFGASRGEAGSRFDMVPFANVNETVVNINYTETPADGNISIVENEEDGKKKFSLRLNEGVSGITGSVYGGAENGHVTTDTKVDITGGYIGHAVYGGGKGKGVYQQTLRKIGTSSEAEPDSTAYIYSVTAGRVFGNTNITMSGGHVIRNIYGGGNMGSIGKGNYAGGADDYSVRGYGELGTAVNSTIWDGTSNDSKAFLSSGKSNVSITSGTIGFMATNETTVKLLNADNETYSTSTYGTVLENADKKKALIKTMSKDNLPTGNVFGGCRGESARNVNPTLSPRYQYCPEFYAGYVNETKVTIGDGEASAGPRIYGSVYGGGQDGHVRRSTNVIINKGEIGVPYLDTYRTLFGTISETDIYKELDNLHWLHRGNVYGAGSGIGKYEYKYMDGETEKTGEAYSNSSGSVTDSTTITVNSTMNGSVGSGATPGNIIHRNVYGGGSLASIGPPKIYSDQKIAEREQTVCNVNIAGTVGTPNNYVADFKYDPKYGGEVYGASRGEKDLDATQFATTVWTMVKIKNGAHIMGNVFGGGDAGKVLKDSEVVVGD